MKKSTIYLFSTLVIAESLLSSCASIIGSSKYTAHIRVVDNPNAQIFVSDVYAGRGQGIVKMSRKNANNVVISLKADGCETKHIPFKGRKFRGWAFASSLVFFTGIGGVPIPYGVIIDLASGSLYKPDEHEPGVSKMDYKTYIYTVNYGSCQNFHQDEVISTPQTLIDVIYLKDGSTVKGIIMEQIPNNYVKIQISDGSIAVYKFDEILKIVKENTK